ncbi:hypothetical protein SAMN05880574_103109 [Chryseobacterium sp. RU37D]|uniref:hypothetical protein n=1 Tax=Chryseobacterium sp. RU37D TaxID=1907397 RepID=UPI0009559C94|nr:hypothetical protein [Chryseobacterium sp. RU37D]SIP98102.1 hypothetical protein SAMN05880574_103109 [Chryseobacterium sp. RU37D]
MKRITIVNLKYLFILFFIFSYNFSHSQQIYIGAKKPNRPLFKVFPVSEDNKQPSDLLKVFMIQEGKESQTPLLGTYSKIKDTIFFEPQFELEDGLSFNAHFYYKSDTVKSLYRTPPINLSISNNVVVKEVFPRSNKISRNILTFYVEFSEPMLEDESAFRYVNLYNENKDIVPHVWLNKSRWITNKILMLMIHPGRVKSGISYYENLGDIFYVGKRYYLEITDKVQPLHKNSKVKPFIKEFEIIEPTTSCPQILQNKTNTPKKNTQEKLKIVFDKPMDLYSILDGISINIYKTDISVEGKLLPGSTDKEWYFVPDKLWTEKKYTLIFKKYVSDPSGNGLIRSFETTSMKKSYTKNIVKRINFKTN